MPAEHGCQVDAQWYTEDRSQREGSGQCTHGSGSFFIGKGITDDAQHLCANESAEETCNDAGEHQQQISGSDGTTQGTDDESGIAEQQNPLSVEPVNKKGCDESGSKGTEGIAGHQGGELRRADLKDAHELRPQRHHDHEVENMGEVDPGQDHHQDAFVAVHARAKVR